MRPHPVNDESKKRVVLSLNQNKPQIKNVKRIENEGDLNMGANSGVECNYEDTTQQPYNPLTQANWGVNEPVIEGSDVICNKGKINMGTNSGITISKGKGAQVDCGVNKPKIKESDNISETGKHNTGTNSGIGTSLRRRAPK